MLLNTYPHLHTYKCTYAHTYVCMYIPPYLHIYKQVNLQAALHSTHVFTYMRISVRSYIGVT